MSFASLVARVALLLAAGCAAAQSPQAARARGEA